MALLIALVVGILMVILELISLGIDKISWRMYVAFFAFGLCLARAFTELGWM